MEKIDLVERIKELEKKEEILSKLEDYIIAREKELCELKDDARERKYEVQENYWRNKWAELYQLIEKIEELEAGE